LTINPFTPLPGKTPTGRKARKAKWPPGPGISRGGQPKDADASAGD